MVTVGVHVVGNSLQANSQPKSVGLVSGLVGSRLVLSLHSSNESSEPSPSPIGLAIWWQHYTLTLVLLDDIAGKRFRLLRSMLPFRGGLFVCHVRALCSNGRRYWYNFFCIRQPLSP